MSRCQRVQTQRLQLVRQPRLYQQGHPLRGGQRLFHHLGVRTAEGNLSTDFHLQTSLRHFIVSIDRIIQKLCDKNRA